MFAVEIFKKKHYFSTKENAEKASADWIYVRCFPYGGFKSESMSKSMFIANMHACYNKKEYSKVIELYNKNFSYQVIITKIQIDQPLV